MRAPVRCSTTGGLNRQTGSQPVLIGKYRSISSARRTLPGPLEMRPDNAAIASSFAQSGRKEVPVGFGRSHSKRHPARSKGRCACRRRLFLPMASRARGLQAANGGRPASSCKNPTHTQLHEISCPKLLDALNLRSNQQITIMQHDYAYIYRWEWKGSRC